MKKRFEHDRHSIRLKGYDYAQPGAYFVTMATYQRECLFGEIMNGEMQLNVCGHSAETCWRAIPEHFPNVELGAYVIMPNHLHGILVINDKNDRGGTIYRAPTGEQFGKPVSGSLPTIIRTFKAAVTRDLGRKFDMHNIWQRNYGACPERSRREHIIRNEKEWDRIRRYIEANPSRWAEDNEYPLKTK